MIASALMGFAYLLVCWGAYDDSGPWGVVLLHFMFVAVIGVGLALSVLTGSLSIVAN